jgi:4-hydroxymandelate oxidase
MIHPPPEDEEKENASPTLPDPVCLSDFERIARGRIPAMAWEYISGGAGDENSLRWNCEAWDLLRLLPRVLVDVSRLDTRVTLFGREMPLPILLAPTAYHRLVHPDGELATVRGAGAAGVTMIVSTLATVAIEEIARAAAQPLWFQLYVQADRSFTRDLVRRAEEAGCQALCVTVDTPVGGARHRETRVKFTLPAGLSLPNLHGLNVAPSAHVSDPWTIYGKLFDPTLTWRDIEELCAYARVPVLLKGVLAAEDAALAVESGAAGVIVSNHGARNLDTVAATAEVLPRVVDRVAGRVPVLVDGGIRRGTDVLKALALGASAVLLGRPSLYALAAAGSEGVAQAVHILRRELQMAMALTGRTSIAQIDRSVLWDSSENPL